MKIKVNNNIFSFLYVNLVLILFCSTPFAANYCDKLAGSWQGTGQYISPYTAFTFEATASITHEGEDFRLDYIALNGADNGQSYSYRVKCENGFLFINEGQTQGEGAFTTTKVILKIFNGVGYIFLNLQ